MTCANFHFEASSLNLQNGQLGQSGHFVLPRVELVSYNDTVFAVQNNASVKILNGGHATKLSHA